MISKFDALPKIDTYSMAKITCSIGLNLHFCSSFSGKCKPKLRILSLPVLCRLNQMSAVDNNKKQVIIFGHPGLVQVPNQVSAKELYKLLRPLMPITDKEVPHLVRIQMFTNSDPASADCL